MTHSLNSRLYVVMGVAGCGKSSVGKRLAEVIGGEYLEGDALHPPGNIEKMSGGTPLTDEDRWPWLEQIGKQMGEQSGIVFAGCSSLKRAYRAKIIERAGEPVTFIFLDGSRELIAKRMTEREGHFMPTTLLDSQFAALERPTEDEKVVTVNIDRPLEKLIEHIRLKLQ